MNVIISGNTEVITVLRDIDGIIDAFQEILKLLQYWEILMALSMHFRKYWSYYSIERYWWHYRCISGNTEAITVLRDIDGIIDPIISGNTEAITVLRDIDGIIYVIISGNTEAITVLRDIDGIIDAFQEILKLLQYWEILMALSM